MRLIKRKMVCRLDISRHLTSSLKNSSRFTFNSASHSLLQSFLPNELYRTSLCYGGSGRLPALQMHINHF